LFELRLSWLASIKSSSKNESKSQLIVFNFIKQMCWHQSKVVQRTKANHNKEPFHQQHFLVGINQK